MLSPAERAVHQALVRQVGIAVVLAIVSPMVASAARMNTTATLDIIAHLTAHVLY